MNHLKTHQTSLMAPWDPLNAPLDPLGPPGPPHRPPMTPKQVSCPHWTLQITSPAFQIIRWPIKCHCWSYGTSYPSPSGLYSLVLPSSESSPGYISRTYLVQFGLVKCFQQYSSHMNNWTSLTDKLKNLPDNRSMGSLLTSWMCRRLKNV